MNPSTDPQAWGITAGYHDISGVWHETPPETALALLEAMGAGERGGAGPLAGDDPVWVVRPDHERPLVDDEPWRLRTEDGADERLEGALPPDLPLGYHRLVREHDGFERLLVVSPGRCHLPDDLHTWGWAVQLYATRSKESWGIGDLADLRRLATWSK